MVTANLLDAAAPRLQRAGGFVLTCDTTCVMMIVSHRRWMLLHALTLPGSALVYALLVVALHGLGQAVNTAIIGAAITGALVLAFTEGAVWLETHSGLDRLFRRINMRASIAAERLARDEDQYVIEGVKDVVFEWRHVDPDCQVLVILHLPVSCRTVTPNVLSQRIQLEALPREDRPVPVVQSYVAVEVNAKLLRW